MTPFEKTLYTFKLLKDRYLFPLLLILAGFIFIIQAFSTLQDTCLSQTRLFLYGGIASLLLGILSVYFISSKKINSSIIIALSFVLIGGTVLFVYFNYSSINNKIVLDEDFKASKELVKQGLTDIQTLQEAYDKKFNRFATSFDSLIMFSKNDSIPVLVEATGDVPTRRMTIQEAKKLGYRDPKEVISESEALKLGLIVRRYEKVPVADYLFSDEKQAKKNRKYKFDLSRLKEVRTIKNYTSRPFQIEVAKIDSLTNGIEIYAETPYGPEMNLSGSDNCNYVLDQEVLKIGSLFEKKMATSWKK